MKVKRRKRVLWNMTDSELEKELKEYRTLGLFDFMMVSVMGLLMSGIALNISVVSVTQESLAPLLQVFSLNGFAVGIGFVGIILFSYFLLGNTLEYGAIRGELIRRELEEE